MTKFATVIGIGGAALGLAGGLVPGFVLYRRFKAPTMRRFTLRAGIIWLTAILIFDVILIEVVLTVRRLVWIPVAIYPFALFFGIWYTRKKAMELPEVRDYVTRPTRQKRGRRQELTTRSSAVSVRLHTRLWQRMRRRSGQETRGGRFDAHKGR